MMMKLMTTMNSGNRIRQHCVLFGALCLTAATLVACTASADVYSGEGSGSTCSAIKDFVVGENNIGQAAASSVDVCCLLCSQNARCVAYTLDLGTSPATCYLKDNLLGNHTESNRVSGTNGRPVPSPTPKPSWNACTSEASKSYAFCDTSLSVEDRLNDLVSRINLTDIGTELTARESEPISLIDLPSYYWGTNAIHGMQNVNCLNDGQCPTSFPAPCALSASFNYTNVQVMASIIADEMRAYYNAEVHNGLDTWSPTININRDPRWGRNVESPGEDPYLNGQFGAAYTTGVQDGVDPRYTKVVVTLKHWLGYSVEDYNGVTRHNFDAKISAYDLSATYLPAWETIVKGAPKALGVMCSYNMLNGLPTCANPNLTAILREEWGSDLYMTSDSDAVADIYDSHHFVDSFQKATAIALEGGCDINSGNTYANNLADAVNSGLVDIKYARDALYRSYRIRFYLGLFDPDIPSPYKEFQTSIVGSAQSQQASYFAARQSMVLLKNVLDVLPFPRGHRVAVLGTSSNAGEDLLGNYDGPICPSGGFDCVKTIYEAFAASNDGGNVTNVDDVSQIQAGVAAAQAADYVVLVASNFLDGGGEGHDRYNISLEASQVTFAEAILAVGKPTVMVLVNGGIIAIDGLRDTAPAILEAFMPGVHGAQAIADTVFGDNNPGGKMPVTMYHSSYINEVDFLNMSMEAGPGRSYRYYTGTPLYEFGYGISYSTFKMSWYPQPPPAVTTLSSMDASVSFTASVTNLGKYDGDEVVMAYFVPSPPTIPSLKPGTPVPKKQLFGFQRIHLKVGESSKVEFTVTPSTVALVDLEGHRSVMSGDYGILLTRGHGVTLNTTVHIDLPSPHREFTFRKWW